MLRQARKVYIALSVLLLLGVFVILRITSFEAHGVLGAIVVAMCLTAGVSLRRALRRSSRVSDAQKLIALTDDQILCEALGDLGGLGAKLGAERMPSEQSGVTVVYEAEMEQVKAAVEDYFREEGLLIKSEPSGKSFAVKGLVGAGRMKMNPAVVTVTIKAEKQGARATVRGIAKEGLMRQQAGKDAVQEARRVLALRLREI